MGGMLYYLSPEAGLDTTEQVQDENIVEEVSVAEQDLVILFNSISFSFKVFFFTLVENK